MPDGFIVGGKIQLEAPTNLKTIAANIQKELGNIKVGVDLNIRRGATTQIATMSRNLERLNTVLATTTTQATSAANAINRLADGFNGVLSSSRTFAQSMSQIATHTKTIKNVTSEASDGLASFGRNAELSAKRFLAFGLAAGTIIKFTQAIREGIGEAISFQREMVRLAQVSTEPANEIRSVEATISKLSTTLGVASRELADVAVTFKQAGLSINDTKIALEAVAEASLAPTFTNTKNTVEGAIAAMQQFKLSANDLKGVLGSINQVSADFAVESNDLVTAIQKSGGAFQAAGGNLNELLAVFTSVRQTTRESADTIATGLRTIFARLQRPQTIEDLKQLGIVLRTTREEADALGNTNLTEQFVGPFEAIRRISEGLKGIESTDPRFAQVIETIGGLRQLSKVVPAIQQFSVAQNALNSALGGTGSLTRSTIQAQDALIVQVTKLREQYNALFRDLIGSKAFNQFASSVLTLASSFATLVDIIKPLLPLLTALTAIKIGSSIGGLLRGFKDFKPLAALGNFLAGRKAEAPVQLKRGGFVPGSGHGDKVPALLEPGEFVLSNPAVNAIGANKVAGLNRLANGGTPDPIFGKNPIVDEVLGVIKNKFGIDASKIISSVNIHEKPTRAGTLGQFRGDDKSLHIGLGNINKSDDPQGLAKFTVAHELGHALDLKIGELTSGKKGTIGTRTVGSLRKAGINRADFAEQKGVGFDPRYPTDEIPEEGFADLFADAVVGKVNFERSLPNKNLINQLFGAISPFVGKFANGGSVGQRLGRIISSRESDGFFSRNQERRNQLLGGAENRRFNDREVLKDRADNLNKFFEYDKEPMTAARTIRLADQSNPKISKLTSAVDKIVYQDMAEKLGLDKNTDPRIIKDFLLDQGKDDSIAAIQSVFGLFKGFAKGGAVSDTIPAMLTPGEYVINAESAAELGDSALNTLNRGKIPGFNKGGWVGMADGGDPGDKGKSFVDQFNEALNLVKAEEEAAAKAAIDELKAARKSRAKPKTQSLQLAQQPVVEDDEAVSKIQTILGAKTAQTPERTAYLNAQIEKFKDVDFDSLDSASGQAFNVGTIEEFEQLLKEANRNKKQIQEYLKAVTAKFSDVNDEVSQLTVSLGTGDAATVLVSGARKDLTEDDKILSDPANRQSPADRAALRKAKFQAAANAAREARIEQETGGILGDTSNVGLRPVNVGRGSRRSGRRGSRTITGLEGSLPPLPTDDTNDEKGLLNEQSQRLGSGIGIIPEDIDLANPLKNTVTNVAKTFTNEISENLKLQALPERESPRSFAFAEGPQIDDLVEARLDRARIQPPRRVSRRPEDDLRDFTTNPLVPTKEGLQGRELARLQQFEKIKGSTQGLIPDDIDLPSSKDFVETNASQRRQRGLLLARRQVDPQAILTGVEDRIARKFIAQNATAGANPPGSLRDQALGRKTPRRGLDSLSEIIDESTFTNFAETPQDDDGRLAKARARAKTQVDLGGGGPLPPVPRVPFPGGTPPLPPKPPSGIQTRSFDNLGELRTFLSGLGKSEDQIKSFEQSLTKFGGVITEATSTVVRFNGRTANAIEVDSRTSRPQQGLFGRLGDKIGTNKIGNFFGLGSNLSDEQRESRNGRLAIGASIALPFIGQALDPGQADAQSGGGFAGRSAVSGAAQGAAFGAGIAGTLGLSVLPLTLAAAGVGIVTSLQDAARGIANAKLEQSVQDLSNRLKETEIFGQGGGLKVAGNELGSIRQQARETGILNAGIFTTPTGARAESDKQEKLAIGAVASGISKELNKEAERLGSTNTLDGDEKTRRGQANELLGSADITPLVNALSKGTGVSTQAITKQLADTLISSNQRTQQTQIRDAANKVNTQSVNAISVFTNSVLSANKAIEGFQRGLDAIPGIASGSIGAIAPRSAESGLEAFGLPNNDAFGKTVNQLLAPFGQLGQTVSGTALSFDNIAKVLPIAINNITKSTVDGDNLGSALQTELTKRLGGNLDTGTKRAIAILSDKISDFSLDDLRKKVGTDVSGLATDLLNSAIGPFQNQLSALGKAFDAEQGRVAQNLASFRQLQQEYNQSLEKVTDAQTDAARTSADIQGRRTGQNPLELFTRADARRPFEASQANLLRGTGIGNTDTAGIGSELRRVQQEIVQRQTAPGGSTTAGQQELSVLVSRASNLKQALDNLANTAKRASDIQDRLNDLKRQEDSRGDILERLFTGDARQQFDTTQGLALAGKFRDSKDQTGFALGLSQEDRQLLLRGVEDLGGATGQNLRGQLRNAIGADLQKPVQDKQAALEGELTAIQKQAIEAQVENSKSLSVLTTTFQTIMENSFVTNAKILSDNILNLANTIKLQAEGRKSAASAAFGDVKPLAQSGLSLDQLKSLQNNKSFKTFSDAELQKQKFQQFDPSQTKLTFKRTFDGGPGSSGTVGVDKDEILSQIDSKLGKGSGERFAKFAAEQSTIFGKGDILNDPVAFGTIRGKFGGNGTTEAAQADIAQRLNTLLKDFVDKGKTDNIAIQDKVNLPDNLKPLAGNKDFVDSLNKADFIKLNDAGTAFFEGSAKFTGAVEQLNTIIAAIGPVQNKAGGGSIFKPRGSDTVPAMLTPGEFVVNAKATKDNLGLLHQINAGGFARGGVIYRGDGGIARVEAEQQAILARVQDEANEALVEQQKFEAQRAREKANAPQAFADNVRALLGERDPNLAVPGTVESGVGPANRITARPNRAAALFGTLRENVRNRQNSQSAASSGNGEFLAQAGLRGDNLQRSIQDQILSGALNDLGTVGSVNTGRRKGVPEDPFAAARRVAARRRTLGNSSIQSSTLIGGKINKFADGGIVPAYLHNGEFVVNKQSTSRNVDLLSNINNNPKHFAQGGPVGSVSPSGGGNSPVFNFDQLSTASEVLQSSIRMFAESSSKLSEALASFPSQISLEGKHTVEVIVNGTQALQGILPEVSQLIEKETKAQINKLLQNKFPDAGQEL